MEKVLIAKVAVDLPLPHLDRPFDYLVSAADTDEVSVGVRVKVRFAGQLRSGFVIDLVEDFGRDGLLPIQKVVSPEPVLQPAIAQLARAVADHYGGVRADVLRLAVPPRHATTEKAKSPEYPRPNLGVAPQVLPNYPLAAAYLAALTQGLHPRSTWQVVPTAAEIGDWVIGVLEAAESTLLAGRGVLLLVPDRKSLDALAAKAAKRFGKGSFVCLSADMGPVARYRSFLAAERGEVSLVLGTQAAAFAPVKNLGLISIFDDGNDSYAGQRAPYVHTREVAIIRSHLEQTALLLVGYARTVEVTSLVQKKWLVPISLTPGDTREQAPLVRTAVDSFSKERHPVESNYRLPSAVFTTIREAIPHGPVLIQVPRSGYVPFAVCRKCGDPATCPKCGDALIIQSGFEFTPATALPLSGQPKKHRGQPKKHPPRSRQASCSSCGLTSSDWRCPACAGYQVRLVVIGVQRTAEEIGRAFPGTKIIISSAEKLILDVPDEPCLVLATPQAEPKAAHGYSAAIILDANRSLSRAELRVAEESLRRWLAVTALVRPAAQNGTVLIVGDSSERTVQALVRLDPVGFSIRELAERAEASLPPTVKFVTLNGDEGALFAALELLELPAAVQVVGPYAVDDAPDDPLALGELRSQLNLSAPLAQGQALVEAVKLMLATRSSRKLPSSIRCQIDPQIIR